MTNETPQVEIVELGSNSWIPASLADRLNALRMIFTRNQEVQLANEARDMQESEFLIKQFRLYWDLGKTTINGFEEKGLAEQIMCVESLVTSATAIDTMVRSNSETRAFSNFTQALVTNAQDNVGSNLFGWLTNGDNGIGEELGRMGLYKLLSTSLGDGDPEVASEAVQRLSLAVAVAKEAQQKVRDENEIAKQKGEKEVGKVGDEIDAKIERKKKKLENAHVIAEIDAKAEAFATEEGAKAKAYGTKRQAKADAKKTVIEAKASGHQTITQAGADAKATLIQAQTKAETDIMEAKENSLLNRSLSSIGIRRLGEKFSNVKNWAKENPLDVTAPIAMPFATYLFFEATVGTNIVGLNILWGEILAGAMIGAKHSLKNINVNLDSLKTRMPNIPSLPNYTKDNNPKKQNPYRRKEGEDSKTYKKRMNKLQKQNSNTTPPPPPLPQ